MLHSRVQLDTFVVPLHGRGTHVATTNAQLAEILEAEAELTQAAERVTERTTRFNLVVRYDPVESARAGKRSTLPRRKE